MVERIIRRVREFASVQGVKIESIEMFEILLDNVCAQLNLKEMMRQGLVHLIPKARRMRRTLIFLHSIWSLH
jgi:hypothetical protein